MWKRLLLLAALFLPSVACFEIQGTHTLYLAPDGTVVWTVLEDEIRFLAPTPEARRQEQEDFLDRVAAYEHPAALSMGALYPSSLDARVMREEMPPAIFTEAYFPGIDRLYLNLFSLYGAVSTVELKIGEERARLEVLLWPIDDDEEEDEEIEGDEAASDEAASDEHETHSDEILLALLLECRIVLTEGRFVEAEGFEIVDGGRAVKPLELEFEEAEANNTPVRLSLTWTTREE
jgi:hypothetical protein